MNLVWHQFRKDARQFRVLLCIWGGLTPLDLAVNLGWVGQVTYRPYGGFDNMSNAWTAILPVVLWALVGVLPSLVVLADSPARREGLLATRPLPRRDWFCAKLLFVLGLVVAPWTLQELAHLALQGMPGWVIVQGTLERLLVTLPVAVMCGAYASLWPGYARWARALVGSVVGFYLFALIVAAIGWFFFRNPSASSFESGYFGSMVRVYSFMLLLVLLAVWHSRVHPGVLGRWGGLFVALIGCWFIAWLCPRGLPALRPVDPAAAKSVVADAGFEIPRRGMVFTREQNPERPVPVRFNVSLTPRTKEFPAGLVVEWAATNAQVTDAAGSPLSGGIGNRRAPLFTPRYWNPSYNTEDYAAWASMLSADVLFLMAHYGSSGATHSSSSAGRFDLPASSAELDTPRTLKTDLEARVFRWHKLAELPLKPGTEARDAFGSWEYLATRSSPMDSQLFLRRTQIELATARDPRCSTAFDTPVNRMVFMVYDPQRQVAWLPQGSYNSAKRATHTALAQRYVILNLRERKAFTPEELARCRLIVFEKIWLGSVPQNWQSPAFTLAEMLPAPASGSVGSSVNDPMPRAELLRRLAELKAPAPDAPRREVSVYLLEFLRLVDARGRPLGLMDPVTAQLARFVPNHLDLLLDGLPVMTWTSKRTVLEALRLGVTDSQKPAVIAALNREPELADVLLARGWVEDARAEILRLAAQPRRRSLPLSALRAMALLRDPQIYPRLLEEFESCEAAQYDVLRTLPELEPHLPGIIRRRWREEGLVWHRTGTSTFGDAFKLALRLGEPSALRRAYQMLDDAEFKVSDGGWQLADALRTGVQLSGLSPNKRHDYDAVLVWMRKHRPEDFAFDPARRQFVLKENLSPDRKP